MDPQTESSTEIAERVERPCTEDYDADVACFTKARLNGEPTFTLRSQDLSAPLAVLFWAKCQQRIKGYLASGMDLAQAVEEARKYYFLEAVPCGDSKIDGALDVANAMTRWAGVKKVAD